MPSTYPVSDYLTVEQGTNIFRTSSWWKAIVQYTHPDYLDSVETAIYLWHNDDGTWTQKNKYVVKTPQAWEEDKQLIQEIQDAPPMPGANEEFPVSDYYEIGAGETVFKTDDWWKAIVRIDAKGDYETTEIIVYVWQFHDETWRRRQKYAIKNRDDWEEEREIVSQIIELDEEVPGIDAGSQQSPTTAEGPSGMPELDIKASNHLSVDLKDDW